MKVDVQDKKVVIEIPFEEFTHVYSDIIGQNLDTGENEIGFGIEVHNMPDIDLKLLIKDEWATTYIMKELAEGPSNINLG